MGRRAEALKHLMMARRLYAANGETTRIRSSEPD